MSETTKFARIANTTDRVRTFFVIVAGKRVYWPVPAREEDKAGLSEPLKLSENEAERKRNKVLDRWFSQGACKLVPA